jgi:hypothetical protein
MLRDAVAEPTGQCLQGAERHPGNVSRPVANVGIAAEMFRGTLFVKGTVPAARSRRDH